MTKKKNEDLPPYHELFELPEGESPEDFPPPDNFASIKLWVKRFGPNGLEECPRPWLLSEVPDRATFFDIFGGGRYEVEARRLNGTFYARRNLMLVGDPKPLTPKSPNEQAPPQAAPPQAGGFGLPTGGGSQADIFAMANGNPMALLFLVMMQNAQSAEARAERQALQSVEMMKTIAAMFSGQRQGMDPTLAQMFQTMSGTTTEIIKQQMQMRAPAPTEQRSVEDEFRRAKELMSLAKAMNPGEKEEKIVDILKELMPLIPAEVWQGAAAALAPAANGAAPIVVEQLPVGSMG